MAGHLPGGNTLWGRMVSTGVSNQEVQAGDSRLVKKAGTLQLPTSSWLSLLN